MNATLKKEKHLHLVLVKSSEKYDQMSDSDLVVACQNHNKAAFEFLVKRHQRLVYGYLRKLAPDWQDTSDLAQDVFIRVWNSIDRLRNPKAFRNWLYQLVTNLFYDELRKRPKFRIISIDEPCGLNENEENSTRDIEDISSLPDEVTQRREIYKTITKAMDGLPEQFRTAIILRELEGLSYDQIAEITKVDLGTVKSRIARARMKIQHVLSEFRDLAC